MAGKEPRKPIDEAIVEAGGVMRAIALPPRFRWPPRREITPMPLSDLIERLREGVKVAEITENGMELYDIDDAETAMAESADALSRMGAELAACRSANEVANSFLKGNEELLRESTRDRTALISQRDHYRSQAEAATAELALARKALESLTSALILAEDVLSRRPFSTQMWPNGMHPQVGIEQIRAALAQEGGKSS